MNAIISPDYYYVLTVAGQSNAMAYGEGLPLPDRKMRLIPELNN